MVTEFLCTPFLHVLVFSPSPLPFLSLSSFHPLLLSLSLPLSPSRSLSSLSLLQVQVTSTSLTHSTTLKAETKLEGKSAAIVVAKTFVTPSE